jgi:hypothetical protein
MRYTRVAVALLALLSAGSAAAQTKEPDSTKSGKSRETFWDDQGIVNFTLTADFGQFRHDARNLESPYRPAKISYVKKTGEKVEVPVRIKPRGIWRRKTCDMPPIRLNFDKDSAKHSMFSKQNRIKLAVTCKNNDDAEQWLLREFELYRVQRLLTPLSFSARLAHVTLVDANKHDTLSSRYAFLGEEPEDAAKRMGGSVLAQKHAQGDDLEPNASAMFGVFQYFVGNTDFSTSELHNVMLLRKDSVFGAVFPVARDFDWTGAVNASYAFPDYRLPIHHVTDRLMKGNCVPPETFNQTLDAFRAKKNDIYALYHDSLAAPLSPASVKWTLEYFDEFYDTIKNPRDAKREIIEHCGPN